MRSILKNFVLAPAVIAAAAFAATTVSAETLNVPFNFTVAGKTCPAGAYSVERTKVGSDLVTLRGADARNSFRWAVGPGDPNPTDARIVLKFDEQGDSHALRSIQYGSKITSNLDKGTKQSERAATRIVQGE